MPDDIEAKIDQILSEVRQTNGRVTALEHTVNGNPQVRLPSGQRDRGLVGVVYDHGEIIRHVQTVTLVARWLAVTFGATAIGLVGNLAANLL